MQPIRLFFPLFSSNQLITGANSAYRQEINKLRRFGINYIDPYLPKIKLRNYPYKFSVIFYIYENDDYDMISCNTIANYILNEFREFGAIQSTDYRVVSKIEIQIKKVVSKLGEGCEICFEPTTEEKPDYHF